MSDMVERVARAICERQFGSAGRHVWPGWTTEAEAAIAAMREPTEAMVDAADRLYFARIEDLQPIYQAMIDAALKEGRE